MHINDMSTREIVAELSLRIERSNGLEFVDYIDLDALHWQIGEEIKARDDTPQPGESVYCGACSGSGEGAYDGAICTPCRGMGEVAA